MAVRRVREHRGGVTREHSHGAAHDVLPVFDEAFWNERYGTADRIWSGNPNAQLVAEASGIPAGRALDVGCGEGADAIWLAARGWQVTGVDISQVALDRAARHAEAAGVADRVTWLRADLTDGTSPGSGFDLVSAQYLHLPGALRVPLYRGLAEAVGPGGTFLVVGHNPNDMAHKVWAHVPGMFFTGADVAAELDPAGWTVVTDELRGRTTTDSDGNPLTIQDVVLTARRPTP
jgi:2-polyprenyl-3-methyl-5-hydroxy-6-metoxy-1,4-benzoquinol methylase